MKKVVTEGAPKAIGPYSQGIVSGDLLFTSGQIPLDPETGKLVVGDFSESARQVFRNLAAILSEGGTSFSDVIKATVYLKSMGDFAALNVVYAESFGEHKPARSTFAVAQLPMDAPLEIELIATIRK
jgi:2-iminobutanoate/2-iminopropanoate deaminase